MIESDKGGTNNLYDPENAWTDASGALHMQIKKKSGRWSCAEIFLNRSLGYGTYSVTVRDTSHLEPAAVFSMFTFDESASLERFREMDVEVHGRGNAANKNNAQYAIQPFYSSWESVPFCDALRHLDVCPALGTWTCNVQDLSRTDLLVPERNSFLNMSSRLAYRYRVQANSV